MKSLTLLAGAVLLVGQFASAIQIAPGVSQSAKCSVEATLVSSGSNKGGIYLEVFAKNIGPKDVPGETIVLNAKGQVIDGPSLCFDQATLGANIGVQQFELEIANGQGVDLKCGGKSKPIQNVTSIMTNAQGKIISFTETSAVSKGLFGKRVRTLDCGQLQ